MENIAETENSIETILREKHDALLEEIQAEADALGSNCEYSVTDEFADRIIYESSLIISQFCASQDDYQEIHLAKLSGCCVTTRTAFLPTPRLSPAVKKRMRIPGKAIPSTTMNTLWNMPGTAILQTMCFP